MNCPICDHVQMREVEKDGVLIDICPSCKGVWLDRGELEKIMQGVREVRQSFNQWYDSHDRDDHDDHRRDTDDYRRQDHQQNYLKDNHSKYGNPKHKRKKSVIDVLGDLFD